jgi:hypothetical protein
MSPCLKLRAAQPVGCRMNEVQHLAGRENAAERCSNGMDVILGPGKG